MRLSVSVLAIAVLSPFASPLTARAQTAADPNAPPVVTPTPGAPPADAPPPPPPVPPPAEAMTPVPAPAPMAPAPAPKTWKDLVTFDGLVDAYYLYNFTGDTKNTSPIGSPVVVRTFDINANSFTLNYARLGIGVAPEPVGLRFDLGYGLAGVVSNGIPAPNLQPFYVAQAYATTAFSGLTLDFGKFATSAGAEVIDGNKNWMYSRSILFFNIPVHHIGLRATYKINDMVSLQGSITNGWNGLGFEGDPNNDKTGQVSVFLTMPTGTAISLNTYFGKETVGSDDTRFLADLVVAHTMGNLGLNLNVDYVKEGTFIDNFIGVAAMARYIISDHLTLAARGEFVKTGAPSDDPVVSSTVYEGTLTLGVPFENRFEFRAELRGDFSSDPNFNTGAEDGGDKSQFTGLGAFLAWF